MSMHTYKVRIYDIEWDVGKDPEGDGYDPAVIASLPKEETVKVIADCPDDAVEHALDELSDDFCFLIQGCKKEVTLLPPELYRVK